MAGGDEVSRYVKPHPDSGKYRYYRRVPREVAHLDKRVFVKKSLGTKNHAAALAAARDFHISTEALWAALLSGESPETAWQRYDAATRIARAFGFSYLRPAEIRDEPLAEIISRVTIAHEKQESSAVVAGMLGLVSQPKPRVSDIWPLYEKHNADGLAGMSPNQLRKHKVARQRAIGYLQAKIGDKELDTVTREDALSFREWWRMKVETENLRTYAANRSISDISGMLKPIDQALGTNYGHVWAKTRLKQTNKGKLRKRPPFSVGWVQNKILAPEALDGLNAEARAIVLVFAETGMRPTEICNLRPEDIRLDGPLMDGGEFVPHVEVSDREDRRNKTEYSQRRIPLVGCALWAMQQFPGGFPRYHDKSDRLSAVVNKYFEEHGLKETPRHVLYSLRHTFQDRIENAGASDRMQADLMGHEFGRPVYGAGPELRRRQAFLLSIAFDWDHGTVAR